VISLEFDDGVTLHVPLQESHLISRYVGLGRPSPSSAGSAPAAGRRRAGPSSTPPSTLRPSCCASRPAARPRRDSPSRRTRPGSANSRRRSPSPRRPDQLRAIEETKRDMERTRPMDRLICGDVGFGKTEVAAPGRLQGRAGWASRWSCSSRRPSSRSSTSTRSASAWRATRLDRDAEPLPLPGGAADDPRGLSPRAGGHPDRHPPPPAARRRSRRTSAWSSSTRSSASA
jgi:hypothetical protein